MPSTFTTAFLVLISLSTLLLAYPLERFLNLEELPPQPEPRHLGIDLPESREGRGSPFRIVSEGV
jgi:hypothetical protein